MKVIELKEKNILKAYDGNYLSPKFGYSCANFNVKEQFPSKLAFYAEDNDEETFDLYTKNPQNISCFVCFDDYGKIAGRRMFFKGKSLVNDNEFNYSVEMGDEIRYLYGYYGDDNANFYNAINSAVIKKYGDKLIFTDKGVIKNGSLDKSENKDWVLEIENANFNKYPPVDFLFVCPKINALASLDPDENFLNVLEKDTGKKDLKFYPAYRYRPGHEQPKYLYSTWDTHRGKLTSSNYLTNPIENDEDEINEYGYEKGNKLTYDGTNIYTIYKIKGNILFLKTSRDFITIPDYLAYKYYYKVK